MAPLSSMALKHVLRPPSAVANVLDWKKASGGVATAMAIDVHADRVGLALATVRPDDNDSFPAVPRRMGRSLQRHHHHHHHHQPRFGISLGDSSTYYCEQSLEPCGVSYTALDSISLVSIDTTGEQASKASTSPAAAEAPGKRKRRKRVLSPDAKRKLAGLVHDHEVSGFVVSWPVQRDTGLMGASCGRTLWALEQILEDEGGIDCPPVFSPLRPLCLWNGAQHHLHEQKDASSANSMPSTVDAFGRSSVYARIPTKSEHRASREQYSRDDSVSVAEIWEGFFEHNWPTTTPSSTANQSADKIEVIPTTHGRRTTRVGYRYAGNRVSTQRRRTLIAA